MNTMMQTIFSLFVTCLIDGASGGQPAARLEAGRPFPPIMLPSLENGQPMSVGQFQGKKIILHIFASW